MSKLTRTLLLIDGSAGIYVPNRFYKNFDFGAWGLDKTNFAELESVDHEHYWDAWDELLRDAKHIDDEGTTWFLEQDDALFAVSELEVQDE